MTQKQFEKLLEKGYQIFQKIDLGMFHPNPKINELYIKLRLAGLSETETKKAIRDKVIQDKLINILK